MNQLNKRFDHLEIIMASRSSRRHALLRQLDIKFRITPLDFDESFPGTLQVEDVAQYISHKKATSFPKDRMKKNTLVITADTLVAVDSIILGKPSNEVEAKEMLRLLSGRTHQVITGVSLRTLETTNSFSSITKVKFKELSEDEIEYYVEEYQPYDKAGGYGIQEWIGKIGVEWIEGSFYNVMGLPIQKLYKEMCNFTAKS